MKIYENTLKLLNSHEKNNKHKYFDDPIRSSYGR